MRGAQWTAHGDDAEAAAETRKPARQCAPDAVAFAGDNSWSVVAAILLYGDKAETDFPPEESEHVVLPEEVMRQINALKAGRGRLQ